jgi:hypothetical protein
MKKIIARWLRRVAQRLDPAPPAPTWPVWNIATTYTTAMPTGTKYHITYPNREGT